MSAFQCCSNEQFQCCSNEPFQCSNGVQWCPAVSSDDETVDYWTVAKKKFLTFRLVADAASRRLRCSFVQCVLSPLLVCGACLNALQALPPRPLQHHSFVSDAALFLVCIACRTASQALPPRLMPTLHHSFTSDVALFLVRSTCRTASQALLPRPMPTLP